MADIKATEGLTEHEIHRAAMRISWSMVGEELADLKEMYADQPNINIALVYCAAKTFLKMSNSDWRYWV